MARIKYQCPLCRNYLPPERGCAVCGTTFPSRTIAGIEVTDFLHATHPTGECRCPADQVREKCQVFLDQVAAPENGGGAGGHYKAKILKPLRVLSDKVILDVGCGSVPISHSLAKHNYLIGVDRCARELLTAAPNALGKGCAEIWIAEAASLPIAASQADAIIATDLLEHTITPELLLREFHRALKPGGKLLISAPNLVSYNNRISILAGSGVGIELHLLLKGRSPRNPISGARYPDQIKHLRFFTVKSLVGAITACGFEIERVAGYDPVLSRIPFADRCLRNLCLLGVVLAVKKS